MGSALERVRPLDEPLIESQLLLVLGDVHVAEHRLPEARLAYRNARELAAQRASKLYEGLAWDRLGDLFGREGRVGEAQECWSQAVDLLRDAQARTAATIDIKLGTSRGSGHVRNSAGES
jgi:predicted negative regulator of RcsB-dependent stress response